MTQPQIKKLEKAPTGIEGFDEMTGGGVPRGRTTLLLGGSGSGKTTFALQGLVNGARDFGEPGIFVAFEEGASQIRTNAQNIGWDLPSLERERLFFIDARLPLETVHAGDFELSPILSSIEAKAEEMGATRVVFDAIDVLLMLLDDPIAERREIYRLHEWIQAHEYTAIVTSKTDPSGNLLPARYSFLQFMADCVITLEQTTHQLVSERHLKILKYRGSGFVENRSPLLIGAGGIEVAGPNPMRLGHPVFEERISTGIEGLDRMLDGGYYRGTNVLITGAPGTAKSTLSGAFVDAACRRGERAMFVSFDEVAGEIVRNLRSVNVDLQPHRDAGLLQMHTFYSGFQSAEAHLMRLRERIESFDPQCLVVDPLSAILKSGEQYSAEDVAQRLLYGTKTKGITTVSTSLMGTDLAISPTTALSVSTIADTWIHLSYELQGGEQNRTLYIVKSRGTGHSNQVRELVLSDEGLALADVYTAGGEVLMGTMRWEKEEALRREEEQARRETEARRRELEVAEAEVQARIKLLERELEARRAALSRLEAEQGTRIDDKEARQEKVRQMRIGKDRPQSDGEAVESASSREREGGREA